MPLVWKLLTRRIKHGIKNSFQYVCYKVIARKNIDFALKMRALKIQTAQVSPQHEGLDK